MNENAYKAMTQKIPTDKLEEALSYPLGETTREPVSDADCKSEPLSDAVVISVSASRLVDAVDNMFAQESASSGYSETQVTAARILVKTQADKLREMIGRLWQGEPLQSDSDPLFGKTPETEVPETKPDAPAKGFTEIRRDQVFAAIGTERIYQELKWGTLEEHPQSVGAYITLMRVHLDKAADAWAGSAGDAEALDRIRKVLAIGVACGEQHGMPRRHDAEPTLRANPF